MPPDKCVSQSGTDNAETHVCIRHVLGSDTRIGSVARQRLTGHMDTCNIQSVHRQADRPEDCIAWSLLSFISLSQCSVANLSLRLIIIGSQVSRLGLVWTGVEWPAAGYLWPKPQQIIIYEVWSLSPSYQLALCVTLSFGINVSHRYNTECQPHAGGFTWHCIINKISYFDSTLTSFINWIRC